MLKKELSVEILVWAYSHGYFPMDCDGVLRWFRPPLRAIIPLESFHVSRSLRREINKGQYKVTFDKDFEQVIECCADRPTTWISPEIKRAYTELHKHNLAHSVEIWHQKKLTGGVYGVSLNGAFFAESMFFKKSNASKLALYHLIERLKLKNFLLFEVQFMTDHLRSLGAVEISDAEYIAILHKALSIKTQF